MKRIKNIDLLRAGAILYIMLISLLRSVRAAMAVAYSHPHTSDSWR